MPAKIKRKSTKASVQTASEKTVVSSESLPRRTLEESLRVAQVIRDTYAGKPTSWHEIAKALGVSPQHPRNRYPLWSAVAYGIVIKQEDNTYALAETGRKIFAPTYEGEKEEGIKKALFTPSVLSRFYTDYNGSPLPSDELFPNVLETRYQIPRERTAEAIEIITKNAEFAGALLRTEDGKVLLRFSDTAFPLSAKGQVLPTTSENADGHEQRQLESLPTPADVSSFENVCFVITPIGSEESNERKHADTVLRHLIEPIIKEMNLSAVRADLIAKPGIITKQIIEYVAHSPICVADLSFNNPNAFYELGVRHALKLSTIQIIRKGDPIPFDVSQGRTIIIDTSDPYTIMDRFDAARKELKEHMSSMLKGTETPQDNPISLFLPGLKISLPSRVPAK
jgi:hypothetical protein